ncbi:hypothetical protein GCM10010365_27760 [Streptomyces poonensis]|uniref:Uncharacterized protein n=1 Tax=Streptomyces poonensis TaxID=68255 RepID=A0A918UGT5_9ACTN|nr:hypothetical protein GCM10010365_27760 [Streptomyces poonensis]GLJ88596.1 hypothetical protein GCM10017589_11960 [Streptomyces poonensis]
MPYDLRHRQHDPRLRRQGLAAPSQSRRRCPEREPRAARRARQGSERRGRPAAEPDERTAVRFHQARTLAADLTGPHGDPAPATLRPRTTSRPKQPKRATEGNE